MPAVYYSYSTIFFNSLAVWSAARTIIYASGHITSWRLKGIQLEERECFENNRKFGFFSLSLSLECRAALQKKIKKNASML